MPVPPSRRLLAQLDAGGHSERVRTMALIGRDNGGDPDLARLLDELSGERDCHHHLALVAAAAAADQERLLTALTHPSPRLRSFALANLSILDPGRVLGLLEDVGPSQVVSRGVRPVLGRLVRFAPSRVAALVVDDEFIRSIGWKLPAGLRKNARMFSAADRAAIATALREREDLFFAFIGRFPPSERAAVFEKALADRDTSTTIWPGDHLEVLPHACRHAEARRILGLRAIRASDASRLQYAALLPFADARPILEPELSRPKADDRALGYNLLIACARRERSPEALTETLGLAQRLRNEQDPVRLVAWQSLAEVPSIQVTDDHLDDLGTLVKAAIEARDTSPATIQVLVTFALRLLGGAAEDPRSPRFRFALQVIDDLAGTSGSISFPQLDRLLPAAVDTALVDTLMPRLEKDAARGRYQLTLSLAQSLGRRAWRHDGLQALVARATTAASDAVVTRAVCLWLDDPRTRGERVGQVVTHDESTVTVPIVLVTISRSRQDLLDLLLRPQPLRGRFLEGDVRYLPVVLGGLERWLPRHCGAYRSALEQPATRRCRRA